LDRIAYVNGTFVPLANAQISILDRGFLFADGVYEVVAVLDGGLVDNAAHLARLEWSLTEISLASPEPIERIVEIQKELIARNNLVEGLIYLQITRGPAERDFAFPKAAQPTLVMFTQAKNILRSEAATRGVHVKTVPDIRWERRDIKSIALLAQSLAKQAAAAENCQEAWMVDHEGAITEGSSSTAYIITKDRKLVTRPNSKTILPGCTRRAILALAERDGVEFEERAFSIEEALDAAEAFLTSATTFVTPIVRLDGTPIGDDAPGKLTLELRELYIKFARDDARRSKERA
jgi:D-alanine transaminase